MKLLKTMIVMLLIGNAQAFQLTHIQSNIQDYGKSTNIFAHYVAQSTHEYQAFVNLYKKSVTQETLLDMGFTPENTPGFYEAPTRSLVNETVEYLENVNEGSTRTVGLNSLFQVSGDTLIQIHTQINTGYNADALRVTPSLKLGFTFAKQIDNDNSFTFTLSPKLVLGGDVYRKKTRAIAPKISNNSYFGKVSNGTTVSIEWTHKF